MQKEFKITGAEEVFSLDFAADGVVRTMLAEDVRDLCVCDCEKNESYSDVYENVSYAVYTGNRGSIMAFAGYSDGTIEFGDPPSVEDMLAFINESGAVTKELNGDDDIIIYVSKLAGTTTDYLLIYDEKFYCKLVNMESSSIVGAIKDYENAAIEKSKSIGSYKYAKIKNGRYSRLC